MMRCKPGAGVGLRVVVVASCHASGSFGVQLREAVEVKSKWIKVHGVTMRC